MFSTRNSSIDQLEGRLLETQEEVSRLLGEQLELLEELDLRHVASVDGCRTLGEWVAWKLDMSQQRARRIVRTMKRSADRPELRQALASGVSFDRVEALARIEENVGLWDGMSVGAIHREATRRAGSQSDMFRGPEDRFLVMQPSLDEGWYKFYGGLDGPAGAIVDKVLSQAADLIQERSEGVATTASWRKATALAELCVSDQPMPAQVTVFVDAKYAASANGASGIVLDSGPAVGPTALRAILCESVTEVVARAEDGRYMDYGRSRRTVTPKLHRALTDRYTGMCAIDGCESANRLQAHHVVPWSRGGRTDQDNLVLLCWFHHHTVVHDWGYEIYRQPDHGRMRLRPPPPQDRSI